MKVIGPTILEELNSQREGGRTDEQTTRKLYAPYYRTLVINIRY